MINRLLIILAVLTITACQNSDQDTTEQTNLLSTDEIETQVFSIPAIKDTLLTGKSGTILTIEKNTFIDQNGNPASGEIKIEFKECLDKLDMVIGNMTTTTNGQFLESGGMVYINATSNNEQLAIAADKSIRVEIPSDSTLDGMQVFEGEETDNGINWKNPVELNNKIIEEPEIAQGVIIEEAEDIIKQTNVGYYVKDFHYSGNYPNHTFLSEFKPTPPDLDVKIGDIYWGGNGIILTKDSVIQIDSFEVALVKMDSIREIQWANFSFDGPAIQGQNQFREDKNTNYIFSVKKLGWANIDRLFTDPRTKEIDLIVKVDNYGEYENIYTSMIFTNQSMYLPGYQKKDNTFSFTHGDYEKTSLPVGETTTVLVTAYKDDKPFYAIKTFTIKEEQVIDLKLSATTKDDLKKELKKKI